MKHKLATVKKYKTLIIAICGIFAILFFIYFYGFITYDNDTFGNVYVNDVCIKNKTNSNAVSKIKKDINSTSVKLVYDDGSTDIINYKQAGGKINKDKLSKSIAQLNKETNKDNERALWFVKSFSKKEYTINFIDFNEDRFIDYLKSFDDLNDLTQSSHEISQLIYKKDEWQLKKINSKYNFNLLTDKIENCFQMNKKTLNIKDCLIEYDFDAMKQKLELANEFCNATIEYKNEISITPQLLLSWIETNDNEFIINDDILKKNIKNFIIENVFSAYSTQGKERQVTLANGKTATIKGGTFGDSVDISAETDEVLNLIKKHATKRKSPKMAGDETRISSDKNDGIGTDFLEVNLSVGKLYYIKNNSIYFTADIISGGKNVNDYISSFKGLTSTPTGIFTIKNKTKNYEVSQLLNSKGNYLYTNKVNYYLNILNIPGRTIGISDTTDKDRENVTEENPVTEEKTYFYVKGGSLENSEIKVNSEDEAKNIIQSRVDTELSAWKNSEIEKRKNESSSNESNEDESSNTTEINSNNLTDAEIEEKRKELENSYSYEPRTETTTSSSQTTVVKEVDKTITYGNIEMKTESMAKLYDLVDNGLPVVVH